MLLEPQVRCPAAGNSRWREIMHCVGRVRLSIIGDDRRARVAVPKVQSPAALLLNIELEGLPSDACAHRIADGSRQLDFCRYSAPLLNDLQCDIHGEA